MVERLCARWTGVLLSLFGVVAVIGLVVTDRLTLYIHPRYTVFTVVMAVLGGLACLAALALLPAESHDHPPHGSPDHDHEHAPSHPIARRLSVAVRVLIIGLAAICLLILPPASLTGTTLQKRDMASSARVQSGTDVKALVGSDPATFSVKDWAGLLEQGGPEAVVDRPVKVSGYVLDRDDDSVFYAVRMLVTCCAVDGQPVGIPIQRPKWRDEFRPGDWIELTGNFVENPDARSRYPTVVDLASITKIAEPDQPYVF